MAIPGDVIQTQAVDVMEVVISFGPSLHLSLFSKWKDMSNWT